LGEKEIRAHIVRRWCYIKRRFRGWWWKWMELRICYRV